MSPEEKVERRKLVITSPDCIELQQLAENLPSNIKGKEVIEGVVSFTSRLFELRTVHGIIFSCSNYPNCPPTLVIDVMMAIDRDDSEVIEDFRQVSEADGQFAETLERSPLSSSLCFLNTTSRAEAEGLLHQKRHKFFELEEDLTQETLISFVIFDRNQPSL